MSFWRLLATATICFYFIARANACDRRRSPPPCPRRDCTYTQWGQWGACTAKCGYVGIKTRTRSLRSSAQCGGRCDYKYSEQASCPNTCCPIDCRYTWQSWSACDVTCGHGKRTRYMKITSNEKCGGKPCPSTRTQKAVCGDGRCCPVNCRVGSWGAWGGCNAACERSGTKTRTRPITTRSSCNGNACPSTTDSQPCTGPCCPRNCVLSQWTAWTKCSSPTCKTNSGTQTRSRRIITPASCGGTCSSVLTQSQSCTPIPITCQMSSWGKWQACVATNGKCGGGIEKRTRTITRASYCSLPCPATLQSRACVHSCCPVHCQLSSWSAWSACSSTCGQGKSVRTRTIQRPPSCGGNSCGALSESNSCTQYNNRNCQMGAWTSWSVCDNGCGVGKQRKSRRIVQQPLCYGRKCGPIEAYKPCTDYRNNRDCKVGHWSSWGKCDQTCSVGNKDRTRVVTQAKQCNGRSCPVLKESTQCGSPNNGCEHQCRNGVCSCNAGYYLRGSKQCLAKDCGLLTLSYCAPGTRLGTTCKHAAVSCPKNQTTYPVTCSLLCPSTYALQGARSVTCTTAGTWSSSAATYCRRINDPPTRIILSGSRSISENSPRDTLVGVLTSLDPNPRDSHTYTLISGGEAKFTIRGNKLYTTVALNYETMNKRYDLKIRSTDNGNPSLFINQVITVTLTDINERPTSVQLSNRQIAENPDLDAVVGLLSTTDEDNSQTHSYTLIDSAAGRFKIDGRSLKVAISNGNCLAKGGDFCKLNYEANPSHQITVRSADNGNPVLSINATFTINLTDVNDQPRELSLSGNTVNETAKIGTVIGRFSAQNEDSGQHLTYTLSDDDQGRFAVSSDGILTKVLATDYETNTTHFITAVVKDDGTPVKQMKKTFMIEVLNAHEPPVSIHLTDKGGQLSFPRDQGKVNENATVNAVVGSLEATDDEVSQNLIFTLDINPLQSFVVTPAVCTHPKKTITKCTAQLKVKGSLNYEVTPSLKITVRVTDQHGKFIVRMFNITVLDNNDRPSNVTISGNLEASVVENSRAALIGELVTTDEDKNQNHHYNLLSNTDIFEVRRNRFLYLKDALDYEQKTQYVVMVTSTDDGSPALTSSTQSFIVHVIDQNEAPVGITLSNANIQENSPSGTVIGNFTIQDPDNFGNYPQRQSHVCRLTNSAQGKFQIVLKNGQNFLIQAVNSLDYEQAISHNISVLCSDPYGLKKEADSNVIVDDVNEAPIKVALSNSQIPENNGSAVVGILSTQDPDNANNQSKQSFNYFLNAFGASPFVINGNVLRTTRSLNYENSKSWTVSVRARDSGKPSLYRDERLVVDVLNVNDKPFAIQLSNVQIKENSGVDAVVGNLATSDQDIGQRHAYTLLDTAGGRFKIEGRSVKVAISNTLCLQFGGSLCGLNYEAQASFNISIRTTDNGNPVKHFDQTFIIYLTDDNDRPRDLTLDKNKIYENATSGTVIGSFTARDEDAGQNLSFSLIDTDGGRFVLLGNKLVTAKSLDHEANKSHVIRVAVTDNGYNALKLTRNFIIEVLNVNEAPVTVNFTGPQTPEVFENTTTGKIVGTLLALDTDANQDLKFSLDDDSQGEFSLESLGAICQSSAKDQNKTKCTVKLLLSKPLNYEINAVRSITVRVTDNHGLFTVERFDIKVLDSNDVPTSISLGGGVSAVVAENFDGALVGELETRDEDRLQTWIYSLMDDFGGLFRVNGTKIYVSQGRYLNYEKRSKYILTVKSLDNGVPAYGVSRNFTIFVTDINEAPTSIEFSNTEILENSPPGTVISNVTVNDPDNIVSRRQIHLCVVVNQNKFRINSGRLVSSVALDYETTPFIYNVSIECTDSGSPRLKLVQDFTVTIRDINEAPSDIVLSGLTVLENRDKAVIATISTIDPDNEIGMRQSFSYRLIAGVNLPFKINDTDSLITTRALDYEVASLWNITIESRDTGTPPLSVNRSFVISVQDVNERPSKINLSPKNIKENSDEGRLVGKLSATDEDFGQVHQFTLLDSAFGRFKLVNNSEIRVAISNTDCLLHGGKSCLLNYEGAENFYTILVRATDDGIPPQQLTMGINITLDDVNDQPRDLALSKYWVKENVVLNTTVGYFTASDEDKNSLSYTLVRGGRGLFGVETNGRLYVANPVDHEKSSIAHVTVRVTDSGVPPKSMEKKFTIIIKNVNEAPVNTSLTSTDGQQSYSDDHATINENSAKDTVVGTLVSLDDDAGQILTYTMDDDAGGRFSVDTSTITCHNGTSDNKTICTCKLVVSGHLNYEDIPSHEIIVEVSDGNHSRVSNFTITLLDKNDQPENVTIQSSLTGRVKENANDKLIGELVTTDEDVSQSHVYTLKGSTKFTIKGNKLFTSQRADLNYEEKQEFTIEIMSTDNGRPPKSIEQNLTIEVEDVNEPPSNIILSGLTIAENSQSGTLVANITIDDPDNRGPKGDWQTHKCQLVDSAQDRFKISGSENSLLVSSGDLNYEQSTTHGIIIRCVDSGSKPLTIQKSFDIQVLDINERPEQIKLSNKVVSENGGPLLVGELSTIDPDKAQSFKYFLVSASEENMFYINGSQLRTYSSLDYESRNLWQLAINTVDQGGLNLTQDFSITIRDTNDQPTDILISTPLAISENSNLGSSVTVFTAVDQDAGQTHRFFIKKITAFDYNSKIISGYEKALKLDPTSGKLTVASYIDYEAVTGFKLEIMTEDNGYPQFTFNKTFTLDVLDVNEAPNDLTLDKNKIAENSAVDSLVGNLNVSDPDNVNEEKHFYTCHVVNNVPFKVSKMRLVVSKADLDFETKSDYSVKINCTENGNSTFSIYQLFQVFITDVNEAPYNLKMVNGTFEIPENEPVETFVGILVAQDHDQNDTLSFEFSDKEDDSSKFSINGNSLLTSAVFNYEEKSSYSISVVAKDDGTPSLNQTKEFEIQILDMNDKPVSMGFNSSGVNENAINGTVVGNFITDDPDQHDTHSYTLLDYNLTFRISGDKLLVKESDRLDFETQAEFVIHVRSTDSGNPPMSIQENITVKILDVNDKPYEIRNLSNLTLDENTQGETAIVFEVLDQDVGQTHTCFVQDSEFFFLDETPDQNWSLRVKKGSVINYERNSTISIKVNCSDSGDPPLSRSETFTIIIRDVNEVPVNLYLNGTYAVDEIAYVGYSLGDLMCEDPDREQTCSFQVIGEFDETFNVTRNAGLQVISNAKLDYEKLDSPFINVSIKATDDGQPRLSLTRNLNITVNEVNEGANEINLSPGNITFEETAPVGTNISELVCNNPEKWQVLEYTLISSGTPFEIVKEPYNATFDPPILTRLGVKQRSFELYKSYLILSKPFLNYDISPNYTALVQVTDNGEPPKSFNGSVHVNVSRIDPCLPVNNCSVNASCDRIDGFTYSCACLDGFEGDGYNCSNIDDCLSSEYCEGDDVTICPACDHVNKTACLACEQNGTECLACERNATECLACERSAKRCDACENNATCHDHVLTFSCTCPAGYNGTRCGHNINECEAGNFHYSCNEGHSTCTDGINNITCDCDRGFTDWLCETNIDDCASQPCHPYGECIDHIGSYECRCNTGYMGSRCERFVRENEDKCPDKQIYVPWPSDSEEGKTRRKESEERESGNSNEEEVPESKDDCFGGENVIKLYFSKDLLKKLKEGGASIHDVEVIAGMRIELEDWLKKVIQVWYIYAKSFNQEGDYNLSDVGILDDVTVNPRNISVSMIARVGKKPLSRTGFICSLNRSLNCSKKLGYPKYTSNDFRFTDYLCPTVKNVDKLNCKTRESSLDALHGGDNSSASLPGWSIYLLASIGGVIFLLVLVFACYADRSQRFNFQEALRSREQYNHVRLPEEDDEHYRDVMFRHHVSTNADGEVNPIYGLDENEDDSQMVSNRHFTWRRNAAARSR
ncbi:protocadherin Fat 4-like [Dendronephthya gigantea]|uniref:protocadherin Fat 4-like n=1 Tax=Dendronephthya gigantea TaxID=151771 RepID=UPI00106C56A0|nr:protocadherin Fat 4-like [Dendronephthya gigantea]